MAITSITYAPDDLIENPGYVIASILCDEVHTERDLLIDVVSGADITIDGSVNNTPLNSTVNDYYNAGIFVNVTRSERYSIDDYVGSTQKITLDTVPSGWAAGDKCYIKNINSSLHEDSFFVVGESTIETGTTTSTTSYKLNDSAQNFSSTVKVGMRVKNTTDSTYSYVKTVNSNIQLTLMDDIFVSGEGYIIYGTRSGWSFAKSLSVVQPSQEILRQACYESNSMLFKDYEDKYKLVSLEGGASIGTLTTPIIESGIPQVYANLTPVANIYTDFTLNYAYDYAQKKYKEIHFINKNSTSDSSLDTYKTNCKDAEEDYKLKRNWEYNADWIQDGTTALYFLSQMVQALTYQRMMVTWTGDIGTHFIYEIGDRVLINYDFMMPTGKNNSTVFLIVGKRISFKKKVVTFSLLY